MRDTIIDGDGHLVEPPEIWHRYTDPALRGEFERAPPLPERQVEKGLLGEVNVDAVECLARRAQVQRFGVDEDPVVVPEERAERVYSSCSMRSDAEFMQ